jgi:hypothetical protein
MIVQARRSAFTTPSGLQASGVTLGGGGAEVVKTSRAEVLVPDSPNTNF